MSQIFISYRRQDDAHAAGRLYDELVSLVGRDRIFMDVDAIPPGVDFVDVLEQKVAACEVLLAIIGSGWLGAEDDLGRRRLDRSDDFVRIEIAAALTRKIPVVPVLMDETQMPEAENLPVDLKPLARRQATVLSHRRFKTDVEQLVRQLALRPPERLVLVPPPLAPSPPSPAAPQKPKPRYSPNDIEQMREALRQIRDVLDKRYAPALQQLSDIHQGWEHKLQQQNGAATMANNLQPIRDAVKEGQNRINDILYENRDYQDELRPVVFDGPNAPSDGFISAVSMLIDDLAEIGEAHNVRRVFKWVNHRHDETYKMWVGFQEWVGRTNHRIGEKSKELREWKND